MWWHITKAEGDSRESDEKVLQRELTATERRWLTLADELIWRVEKRRQEEALRNVTSISGRKRAA